MIRVTIEMVPGGVGPPRVMHVIEIWNLVATSVQNKNFGDYAYRISRKVTKKDSPLVWHKQGNLTRFPRGQKNAVHLLHYVLKDALDKK